MPTHQATIRNATVDDARALAEFNRRMALETEGLSLLPPVLLSGVKAVFEDPARGFYVVAETRRGLVAALMITREWSDWRDGEWWWIQSVYVRPSFRRRGVYRSLYRHVTDCAGRARNVCGLRLYVERENRVAQQTYAALGMRETRYKVFEYLKPGRRFVADSPPPDAARPGL